jgi:DNA-binding NtrC family response regulator
LRILQTGEFERLGGFRSMKCDVRVIAATNRDIPKRIQKGLFRTDLWYRLNVFPIHIPDLKSRKQDIPALVDYFISQKSREMNIPFIPKLVPGAMERLQEYDWPGNVRELQNIIERALIICKGANLSFSELKPGMVMQSEMFPKTSGSDRLTNKHSFGTLNQVMVEHIEKVLSHTHGKVSGPGGAAEILDINPNTLRNRMIKLGILK